MLLYYITDRRQLPGTAAEQRERLLRTVAAAAMAGVDYIQLREKDLSGREQEQLAGAALQAIAGTRTRLLINSRLDVAAAAGAHGVHLRSDDLPAGVARATLAQAGIRSAVVASSCHSIFELELAEAHGADFAVFGPVFSKQKLGLGDLRRLCRRRYSPSQALPVLALGGMTLDNAGEALQAGAAGVAAISMFQQRAPEELPELVTRLRALQ